MCLYPRFIRNKRYYAYNVKRPKKVHIDDKRKEYVPIGCGKCFECRKQKAQGWRVRLMEEIKVNKYNYFVTLTFSNESLIELMKAAKTDITNDIAKKGVRRFLERWRKDHKKSLRHWLITELGHENTERIHLHGIIFSETPITIEILQKYWKYGKADIGEYCNEKTINYIVKYVTKIDTEHKTFMPKIMSSSGLGASWIDKVSTKNTYKYKPKNSAEYYTLNNGLKVALPIYYRNKVYNQKERDKLWTERLDKATIYVNGIRIQHTDTEEGQKEYYRTLQEMQEWNKSIGYGDTSEEWQNKDYKITFEMLQSAKKD